MPTKEIFSDQPYVYEFLKPEENFLLNNFLELQWSTYPDNFQRLFHGTNNRYPADIVKNLIHTYKYCMVARDQDANIVGFLALCPCNPRDLRDVNCQQSHDLQVSTLVDPAHQGHHLSLHMLEKIIHGLSQTDYKVYAHFEGESPFAHLIKYFPDRLLCDKPEFPPVDYSHPWYCLN